MERPPYMYRSIFVCLGLGVSLLLSGCLATKGWVQEQIDPVDGRVSRAEGQLSNLDSRLSLTETKVNGIIDRLDQLKLQRKLVLNMEEGATFTFDSTSLSEGARRQLAGLFSDLGNIDISRALFLVAGHTDNTGSEDYNYVLGQRRASSVAQYMIREQGIDPIHVSTVSYGESNPLAENSMPEGRRRNRRIEIWVYKEDIASATNGTGSTQTRPTPMRASQTPTGAAY